MLKQIHPSVWTLDKPFHFLGQDIGSRMTVIRLENGNLWLHSPVKLTEVDREEVDKLGPVKSVVSPNLMHFLSLQSLIEMYPTAEVFGPEGLERKMPGLKYRALIAGMASPWGNEISFMVMDGMPDVREVVFLHEESNALLVADLVLHIHKTSGPVAAMFAKLNQSYKTLGPSRICKLNIDDHAALRRSLMSLLKWEFESLIVSHGEIVERGGKEKLSAAYRWIFGRIPLSARLSARVWNAFR